MSALAAPSVRIDGPRAVVEFERFTLEEYPLFLACKRLPESQVSYDWETDRYQVTTPARFAPRLGGVAPTSTAPRLPRACHLFDYQRWIVDMALDAHRFAIWADTGLGKTAMLLEWAIQVREITGGRVLILCPAAIIDQTIAEAAKLNHGWKPERIDSREALATWCQGPSDGTGIGIASYFLFSRAQLPELRYLAGVVLDESSILKTGGGQIKWNLVKSARGIEYKLSCTATPAPNEAMEYASQASFLEKITNEGEILWTYFSKDPRGNWQVKPHARAAFYEYMASWSIYLRDPARFGFADVLADLPDPEIHEYRLEMTNQQRVRFQELQTQRGGGLFADETIGVTQRAKYSQIAKGFEYEGKESARVTHVVNSLKPGKVAELVNGELYAGRQVLVWTVFDAETELIQWELRLSGYEIAALSGTTPERDRVRILNDFREGKLDVLISKASMLGYGLNFQQCRSMIFSGFDDSFERMYQAIRRCYRFGQTETVHVHIPYVPELEGFMWDNVQRKEQRFLAEVAAQEDEYRKVLGRAA